MTEDYQRRERSLLQETLLYLTGDLNVDSRADYIVYILVLYSIVIYIVIL